MFIQTLSLCPYLRAYVCPLSPSPWVCVCVCVCEGIENFAHLPYSHYI